jgi:EAL domain-containing protein (putative c-di-GMP-specific phosphodiesterase class I)
VHGALAAIGAAAATGVGRRRPETGLGGALAAAESEIDHNHHPEPGHEAASAEASALVDALEDGAICAYFQPIVNLQTGAVVAIEALARWQSPDGVREPEYFLDALRQAGLLGALFDRILDYGLHTLGEYRHLAPQLQLAVNFQFDTRMETSLLESITEHLDKHGMSPTCLVLEFSERQSFDLPIHLREELEQVAAMGVQLVLDDFGTGFASLETLTSLPINGVKLNRRFTAQVVSGDRASSVVKAMVGVATKTDMTVVAEGIETQLQREQLVGIGCTLGQGYLFALPQPADSLAAVLSAPLVDAI